MAELGTVNSLVAELLTNGRAKANNVVKLVALLGASKQEAALKAAIQGLKQFFVEAGQDGFLVEAAAGTGGARPAKRQKVGSAAGDSAAAVAAVPSSAAAAVAAAAPEDPEAQYRDWLGRQYAKYIDQLLSLATGLPAAEPPTPKQPQQQPQPAAVSAPAPVRSAGVQLSAAAAVMECVRSERGPGVFSGPLYSRLLSGVLLSPEVRPEVFALMFTKYLGLADVRFYTLATVQALCARFGSATARGAVAADEEEDAGEDGAGAAAAEAAADAAAAAAAIRSAGGGGGLSNGGGGTVSLPDFVRNAYDVLCHVTDSLPPDCREWSTWSGAVEHNLVAPAIDRNEPSKRRRKLQQQQAVKQQVAEALGPAGRTREKWANDKTQRRLYGDAWLALLALPLPSELLRKALVRLPTSVLPNITRPHMLADFLTHCLNRGGLTGMLALNGLFLLVTRHGLEYPQFYSRLYQLLVPEAFSARSRAQFFRLADIFLSSTLVPAYTVAAFVKRFARLALVAPPAGAMVAIAFCHNLLRRHPALSVMLHNPAAAAAAAGSQGADSESGSGQGAAGGEGKGRGAAAAVGLPGQDPYDEAEGDPAKSRAVQSSLWELEALRNHYCPQVSTFCAVLDKDLTDRTKTAEVNIEDLLGAAQSEGQSVGAGSYNALINGELSRKLRRAPIAFYGQSPLSLFQQTFDAEDWAGWGL